MGQDVRVSKAKVLMAPVRWQDRWFKGVGAERLVSMTSPVLLLILWELLVRLSLLDSRFFPAPTSIVSTFIRLLVSGELFAHVSISLIRIAVGFLIGGIPGLMLGILMGLSRIVRAALNPMVGALYPIPKTAIFPLLLVIFGIGEPSKYAFVATGVFFIVLLNTMAGVMGIEPVYLDVGKKLWREPPRCLFHYRAARRASDDLYRHSSRLGQRVALDRRRRIAGRAHGFRRIQLECVADVSNSSGQTTCSFPRTCRLTLRREHSSSARPSRTLIRSDWTQPHATRLTRGMRAACSICNASKHSKKRLVRDRIFPSTVFFLTWPARPEMTLVLAVGDRDCIPSRFSDLCEEHARQSRILTNIHFSGINVTI